ncbi:toxin glutamine deamidase domain-containing protein [Actinoallomurus iriomotensis]|uniref:toxin glutamine deamidase domain-containing protein n=1 Tax=Actinoallomurus iriomotensis TaxID=478107 RepID=UPI002555A78A|nr:toxin glutamine deamidase domain-containing protein [Actinoallomurus iriomotensis]
MAELERESDGETDASLEAGKDDKPTGGDTSSEDEPAGEHENNETDDPRRQRELGKELATLADKKIDKEIDQTLDKVNPKYERTKSAYSENCTGVVQANELQRRGIDAEAGPLESHLRTDQGGPGGRPLDVIEDAWDGDFTDGTKSEIEAAFKEPGARGVVYIVWHGNTGAHVFNVENVGGKVRFVDGQPTPPVMDASHYFNIGGRTAYLRLDDLQTPDPSRTKPYLEH